MQNENTPYSKWIGNVHYENVKNDREKTKNSIEKIISKNIEKGKTLDSISSEINDLLKNLSNALNEISDLSKNKKNNSISKKEINFIPKSEIQREFTETIINLMGDNSQINGHIKNFLIYSPENSSLRLLEKDGQIEPLGINGEGLLRLLHLYSNPEHAAILNEIKTPLKALAWFEDLNATKENNEEKIVLNDRYLDTSFLDFDQKSANEGFLFLLFYFTLFNSKLTPDFFAIDNIDASLNPKLCMRLTSELVKISKNCNKQVILTTHNPAVLDGLNLDDDDQRLFVISRSRSGATKIKRVMKPRAHEGDPPYRLSELFLRGTLGGLPKGF